MPVALRLSVELGAAELDGLPDGLAAELMRALLAVLVIVVWVPWVDSVVPPVVWVLGAVVLPVVPVVASVVVPVVAAVVAAAPLSEVISLASGSAAAGLVPPLSRAGLLVWSFCFFFCAYVSAFLTESSGVQVKVPPLAWPVIGLTSCRLPALPWRRRMVTG